MTRTLELITTDLLGLVKDVARSKSQPAEDVSVQTMLRQDLEFSSMDIIHLLASIDMHFNCKLRYDRLFQQNGGFTPDFSVSDVANFVYINFDDQITEPMAM
jgi:acyl carrier protein